MRFRVNIGKSGGGTLASQEVEHWQVRRWNIGKSGGGTLASQEVDGSLNSTFEDRTCKKNFDIMSRP